MTFLTRVELHPDSDEPEVLVLRLELQHTAHSLLLHHVLNINGHTGLLLVSHYLYFGAPVRGEGKLSVDHLLHTAHADVLVVRLFLLLPYPHHLPHTQTRYPLHHLEILNLHLHHTPPPTPFPHIVLDLPAVLADPVREF